MSVRTVLLAVVGACLLCAPAQAQNAEAAGGSLRFAGGSSGSLNFVVTDPPRVRPTGPIEIWEWTFYRNERTAGHLSFDTGAYRVRIDCQAGTRQVLGAELFRDGEHLLSLDEAAPAATIASGTVQYGTVQMACEPGFAAGREAVPDHRAARARVDQYYRANP